MTDASEADELPVAAICSAMCKRREQAVAGGRVRRHDHVTDCSPPSV
jgi:hypothetical protein